MRIQFLAVDRDSSDGYTSVETIHTEKEFFEAWNDFELSVPYRRWYDDNQFESGTPDEEILFNEWNATLQ